ncbi:MAG: ABC transporter permease [Rhodospirillales bacterium]|nr:ABC transporter permease [Rhodospirillales bacterium]MDH3916679.1 ABC transporter permease [Rhodospirillales bacterium]MDH3965691.1 ABC transporter permease [Rhodospirillales bacterium]
MTAEAIKTPEGPPSSITERTVAGRQARTRGLLLAPAMLVIGVFGILPLFIALTYSFLEGGTYGGVEWVFSTEAYVQLLFERDIFEETLTFNTAYLEIFWRSFLLAAFSTLACLLIGFPAAYFMATRPAKSRDFWVFLITIPFWTNLLIRTFSIQLILRDEGVINIVLTELGLLAQPLQLIYTDFAVGLGLIYSFLPFMVLPIYAALERLDFRLVEAGFDLYATRAQVLRRIVVPLAKPGIVAGSILVFIPGLGAWITPELLGGGKELMIGNMIALQFGSSRNWPFGSAAALVLMAMVLVALVIYVRNVGKSGADHG